jgi:hypothetical protein
MTGFESSKQHGHNLDTEQTSESNQASEQYGLRVSYLDDNEVHVTDRHGIEIAFEFPMKTIELSEYDNFIEQFQNSQLPLPPIETVRLAIGSPVTNVAREGRNSDLNSEIKLLGWDRIAQQHGISIDELKSMYLFAREQIYVRFKRRLRNDGNY